MSREPVTLPPTDSELVRLVESVCDGTIEPAGRQRLESLLTGDPQAQLYYVACLDLHVQMRRLMRGRGKQPSAGCAVPVLDAPWLPLSLFNPAPWAAYATAGLLLAIGVLAAWVWSLSDGHPDSQLARGMQMGVQIAATAAPAAGKTATAPIRPKEPTALRSPTRDAHNLGPSAASQPPGPIVCRITEMTAISGKTVCDDIDRYVRAQPGTPVRVGWEFLLDSGRLELTYNSGAKVIIEGPVKYTVEQENGGFLSLGKLTVNVRRQGGRAGSESEGVGKLVPSPVGRGAGGEGGAPNRAPMPPAAPVFIVRTPFAIVNDADGEFGIKVDKSGGSRTQVFRGRVLWRWECSDGPPYGYAFTLKEKYQAQLDVRDGEAALLVLGSRAHDPMRAMPAAAPVVAVEKMKKSIAN